MAILGVINILYGAFCAMAQKDLKKLVAYSSVSHMGYVMLGMASFTTAGVNGAVLQMFNHGTSTAMLFLLVGVIYDRVHHRWIVKPDGSQRLRRHRRGGSGLHRNHGARGLRVAGTSGLSAASSAKRWCSSARSRIRSSRRT